jgi:hypothetical protein
LDLFSDSFNPLVNTINEEILSVCSSDVEWYDDPDHIRIIIKIELGDSIFNKRKRRKLTEDNVIMNLNKNL